MYEIHKNSLLNNMFTTSDKKEMKKYQFKKNGLKYAGVHLIIDIWNASDLKNLEKIKLLLVDLVKACDATLYRYKNSSV